MKKKDKGFTLIELLAVIVILGLLMAIAIPSVTKYITQSRKKTVSTTIGNYMGALTNQVNDMEYVFTGTNTIYAVPIECISLERGGTNPFGKWHQSNDKYWAYVLVQYDDATSSYTYGFTFKDSAGYGLYPTTSEKLNENGSQIQTGLSLTRPTNGNITNITVKDNWLGFDVDNNTSLVVLEASSEGGTGNGTTTCTLCQKGDNYAEVEEEKNNGSTGLNKYNFYYGVPYRFVDSLSDEFYAGEVIFTKEEKVILNTYSDNLFSTLLSHEVIDLKEKGTSYDDIPIKQNGTTMLDFSENGRKAYVMGRTYYLPSRTVSLAKPTLNEYGFFYDTEYVLLEKFLGIDYLTIEFDRTGSAIAFFYTDSSYTTFHHVSEVEKNQYKYENGKIIQLSPSGGCCSNVITISDNGEKLVGCDCDIDYDSIVWYKYFNN